MFSFGLLETLGLFGIAVTAIAWLVRELFKHSLNLDVERFKSQLEKESIEFRVRYERIHQERVTVIKEVYKLISRTYSSFRSLINPLQLAGEDPKEEKMKLAAKNANKLTDFYNENRIFFDEKLAEDVDKLLSKFRDVWNKYQYAQEIKGTNQSSEALREWRNAWDDIQTEVSDVKKELESKFRNVIGIE